MPRGIKPVVNPLALLSLYAELARITTLPGGENDPARAILSFVAGDAEGAVFQALERLQPLLRPHLQPVVAHDLTPARDQVFLAGAVQPEFPLRWCGIRFRINPFAFRKV